MKNAEIVVRVDGQEFSSDSRLHHALVPVHDVLRPDHTDVRNQDVNRYIIDNYILRNFAEVSIYQHGDTYAAEAATWGKDSLVIVFDHGDRKVLVPHLGADGVHRTLARIDFDSKNDKIDLATSRIIVAGPSRRQDQKDFLLSDKSAEAGSMLLFAMLNICFAEDKHEE